MPAPAVIDLGHVLPMGQRIEVDARQVAGRLVVTVVAVDPMWRSARWTRPLRRSARGRHRPGRARGASFDLRTRR